MADSFCIHLSVQTQMISTSNRKISGHTQKISCFDRKFSVFTQMISGENRKMSVSTQMISGENRKMSVPTQMISCFDRKMSVWGTVQKSAEVYKNHFPLSNSSSLIYNRNNTGCTLNKPYILL